VPGVFFSAAFYTADFRSRRRSSQEGCSRARASPHLELVELPLGHVLYEPGDTLSHAYFPTDSIISLLYVTQNGTSAEIAVVGSEGVLGVSLFMGGNSSSSRAVVQNAGHGFRIKAQILKDEFNKAAPVLHLLLRYTQALITQMTQTAACYRHPLLPQQLCRWLLLSLDRLKGDHLVMTQQLVANMLECRSTECRKAHSNCRRQG
jgi:CRP-like cAMP-binding protein